MDNTASSISASFSRNELNEEMSMSFASRGDAQSRISEKQTDDSISNERICRDDDLLGTYKVISDPIEGGMGSVYCVHHKSWNIDLAMKRPKARFFTEASDLRKAAFIEECDYWIRLGLHPNIVSCYYVREIGGVPSIFSEWMDGGSLKDRMRDGSLYEGSGDEVAERILDVAIQAARGLRYSHESGLIHQDVKPGNILLSRDWDVKVADFGIAQASAKLEEEDAAAKSRPSGYTPQYCPAEQAAGEKPARWMDVYAFALTVLEMYTGERLWETGADARSGAEAFYSDPKCRVRMPESMQTLLDTCLTGKPDGFADVEASLEEIYREVMGRSYPRKEAKAASDTPDSLNNRALSFLDLGQPAESLKLWERALYVAPGNVPARFNRELYLLRSGQKQDYEAMDALTENDVCRKADAAADIFREWDRTRTPIPHMAAFEMEDCATGAALSSEHIVFTFGDSNAAFSSEKPHIRRVRRDGKGGYERDNLTKLHAYGSTIVKLALHPGGETAAVLLANGTLCLYDIRKRYVTRAVHTLPEDYIEDILANLYHLRCSYSPDGSILAIYNEKTERETLLVEMPSMRLIAAIHKSFCAFSRDNRPLVMGRAEGGTYAIFEIDPLAREREVFRFGSEPEQYITKRITACPFAPFLSFTMTEYGPEGKTEETFFLDEDYRKVVPQEKAGEVLFLDPEKHLLYSVVSFQSGNDERYVMAVKDSGTLKTLFSVEMGPKTEEGRKKLKLVTRRVLCDSERKKILTWETQPGKTGWGREAPFPSVTKNEPASYRLSEIVTVKERREEDERLTRFLLDFGQADTSKNYGRALDILEKARTVPGFHGSAAAIEMEGEAERFGERFALRTIHQLAEGQEMPDLFYVGKNWYRCRDGLIAVYASEGVSRSGGIHFYKPDGTLVRSLQMPSFASGQRVQKERVFAWIGGTFHAAVYDLEGNLLHATPEGWPPPPDHFSDYRSPHIMDIDSSGRYMLFGMAKRNQEKTAPVSGIFEIDLDTGHMHMLADYVERYDKYKRYGYFDDDTILIRTGKTLSRFAKGTRKKLLSYRINCPGRRAFYVRMNADRDRFYTLVMDDGGSAAGLYAFHKDGKQLYCEQGRNTHTEISWFPGNRFACLHGTKGFIIRDMETEMISFEADTTYSFDSMSPDGRILYVRSQKGNRKRIHTYELEYAYKIKGTPDPQEKFKAADIVEEETPSSAGNTAGRDAAGESVSAREAVLPVSVSEEKPNPEETMTEDEAKNADVEYDETVLYPTNMALSGDEKTVVIPDGIRRIGTECFMNRTCLEKVMIPESVTEIGNRAFMNCQKLTSVSIPGTVRRIGEEAFRGCAKLKKIKLPEDLRELGVLAFMDCGALQEVKIPEGPVEIGRALFAGCLSLQTVTLPEGIRKIDGDAFENCNRITELVIPDSVYHIHGSAFRGCESLSCVKLPAKLGYIDDRLFQDLRALQGIEIPEGVREIEEEAFGRCTSLAYVRFPKSLRKIGKRAFSCCTSLAELSMPDGCTEIGEGAFSGCASMKSAILSDTIQKIGKSAFDGCEQLETIHFPAELEVIGERAFRSCIRLLEVETFGELASIEKEAFDGCKALRKATFAEGLTNIESRAFYGCGSLSMVQFPDTLTALGSYAFSGTNLDGTVRIPPNVEKIREAAFEKCARLEAFEVMAENEMFTVCDGVLFEGDELLSCPAGKTGNYTVPDWVQVIASNAFSGCRDLTGIVLSDEIRIIGYHAFEDCTGIQSIRIPAAVSKLSGDAFAGCTSLAHFEVEEGSTYFRAADGILMSADGKELVSFPPARGGEYTVPNRIERIGSAFTYGTAKLKVNIPNGKVKTEWNAFRTDGTLTVDCPKGTPVYETLMRSHVPMEENTAFKEVKKQERSGWLKKLFGRK